MSTARSKTALAKLQQQIEATTTAVKEADHRKNLLAARARGAKAGLKAARKAFKRARKLARKAAKQAKQTHKELRALIKKAGKRKLAAKRQARPVTKRPVRKPARKSAPARKVVAAPTPALLVPPSAASATIQES